MIKHTIIYKVYGCTDDGSPSLYAEFSSVKDACNYAIANRGKIHYGLPEVYKYDYLYNTETGTVTVDSKHLIQEQIYAIAECYCGS